MNKCGKCGKAVQYSRRINGSLWVHTDTGNFMSMTPEPHDANTVVIREDEVPSAVAEDIEAWTPETVAEYLDTLVDEEAS